ncbi:hypothetical protein [Thermogemmatispora sp.]|uniref:hypothetical protein n=1 Tax=Thermogemmatispora sp. TaxID=1968838 RepID=UPI0035E44525
MSRRFAYRPRYFSLARRQGGALARERRTSFPQRWSARRQFPGSSLPHRPFPQPDLPFFPFVHSLALPGLPPFLWGLAPCHPRRLLLNKKG